MTRRVRAGALLAAGTLGVGAAIAIASVPDSNGVIHACYQVAAGGGTLPSVNPGNVRIIDSGAQSCDAASEHAFTFNQQGQPGPQGEQGPPGEKGTVEVPPPNPTAGQVTINGGSRARSLPISGATTFPFLTVGLDITGPGSRASGYGTRKTPAPLVVVTRKYDTFSPKLALACARGEHFKKIVFQLFKGGTTIPYLTYTLTDSIITSVQTSGHGDTTPDETLRFAAQKVTTEYAAGASRTLPAIQYSSTAKTKLKFPG